MLKPNENTTKADVLADRAYRLLTKRLRAKHVETSEDHLATLKRIVTDMARQAYGVHPGRHGYGLPTGFGKSTAVAAFIAAADEVDPSLTVAVASARIDNLREIYETIHAMAGLDEGDEFEGLSVLHSDWTREGFQPTKEPERARYLLTTHEELRGGEKKLGRHGYVYLGKGRSRKRDVFLYDEGFLSTNRAMHDVATIGAKIGEGMKTGVLYLDGQKLVATEMSYGWLSDAFDLITTAMQTQKIEGGMGTKASAVLLPELPADFTRPEFIDALKPEHRRYLRHLINSSGEKVNVIAAKEGDRNTGLVWFDVTIADDLEDMIILDASLSVRALQKHAQSVQIANIDPGIITYPHLLIEHVPAATGRSSLEKMLRGKGLIWEHLMSDLARYVHTRSPGEKTVIWTLKQRDEKRAYGEARTNHDYPRLIKQALADRGIDPDDIAITPDRPTECRIVIETAGRETGVNRYVDYQHTAFVGVLFRSALDLTSEAAAEARDLGMEFTKQDVSELIAAETAAYIYQAASRTQIRKARYGKARPGTIWLPIYNRQVLDILTTKAFPGATLVQIEGLTTDHAKKRGPRAHSVKPGGMTGKIVDAIIAILAAQEDDVDKVTMKKITSIMSGKITDPSFSIEKGAGSLKLTEKNLRDANAFLERNPPAGWVKLGRSWMRETAQNGGVVPSDERVLGCPGP